ncbi:MAG: hypothetical protein ACLPVO_05795 [Desulfomonilaceae bacterium]
MSEWKSLAGISVVMALPHSTLGIGGAFSASRLTERWSLLSQEAGLQVE